MQKGKSTRKPRSAPETHKRKRNAGVEFFKHPPKITKKDLEEEAKLEELLFGDSGVASEFGKEIDEDEGVVETQQKKETWSKTEPEIKKEPQEDDYKSSDDDEEPEGKRPRVLMPAWSDAADESEQINLKSGVRRSKLRHNAKESTISGSQYSERLRAKFEQLHAQTGEGPDWAKLPIVKEDGDAADDDDALLATTAALVGSHSQRLRQSNISIMKLNDANQRDVCKGKVGSVQFHPSTPLLLTSGLDKTLRLFQVDGKKNTKVQGVCFHEMPIHKAFFTRDGKEVINVGRKPYFYVYDIVAGKATKVHHIVGRNEKSWEQAYVSPDNKYLAFCGENGYTVLVSNQTKQWIGEMKITGPLQHLAFSPDSNYLFAAGPAGTIYQWDMRTRRCLHKFSDEGVSGVTTSHAISNDNAYHCIGSDSGVVNIYNSKDVLNSTNPKPLKALMNLSTAIRHTKFNYDTQILAISAVRESDAFRLVHLPSLTVFNNFPHEKTGLGVVTDFDFSPHSGFLAIGASAGRVRLYKLNHYRSV